MSWISSKFGTIYIVKRLTGVFIFLDNLTFYHVYITVIKSSDLLCAYINQQSDLTYNTLINLLLLFSCSFQEVKKTLYFITSSFELHTYMANEMRFIQTWGEVAPSLSHRIQQRRLSRSSSQPKLETILEEGCDSFFAVQAPKRIVIFLPLLLSIILYFFLYKTIKDYWFLLL